MIADVSSTRPVQAHNVRFRLIAELVGSSVFDALPLKFSQVIRWGKRPRGQSGLIDTVKNLVGAEFRIVT